MKKIDDLAQLLELTGADAQRLDVVRRLQRFKRSWIELAEALVKVRATVDKLTASYSTVQRHAPEVLGRDGAARAVPHVEAVEYFSRALEKRVRRIEDELGALREDIEFLAEPLRERLAQRQVSR